MQAEAPERQAPLTCVHCGYDLRGLGSEGRCPECGLAIARSVFARDHAGNVNLVHANARWLSRVAMGCACVAASGIAPFAWLALWVWSDLQFNSFWYVWLLVPVPLTILGVLLVALREPILRGTATGRTPMIVLIALTIMSQLYLITTRDPDRVAGAHSWLLLTSSWSALLATMLLLHRLATLARRIPSRSYVIQARVVAVGLCVGALVLPSWRLVNRPLQLRSLMLLTDTYRPINVGFGHDFLAVALVQRAMAVVSGAFRPERDPPDRIASWFGIFPIWAAGLYASFAHSLWQIRRESLRVAARDSAVPRPISFG